MLATGGGERKHGVVLVADGCGDVRRSFARMLRPLVSAVYEAATADQVLPTVTRCQPDLVLWHPRFGLDQPRKIRTTCPACAVVGVSGSGDVEDVCTALEAGAAWYVVKGRFTPDVAARLVAKHVHRRSSATELVGRSAAAVAVRTAIERMASSELSVLVLGPTGSGKEVVARLLHERSGRPGPLVARNCAGMPRDLIDDMLFGHERGAFTGAVSVAVGAFELAHGGTLLLDEIAELPLDLQAKLLRVLQDRTVLRLGGQQEARVDVRVIAATNRDLRARVQDGSFREDLYYRLDVLSITLPPLSARPDDIGDLVTCFAREVPRPVTFLPSAIQALRERAWPGNIRQLWAAVRKIGVLSSGDDIGATDVERVLGASDPPDHGELARAWLALRHRESAGLALERALFTEAWRMANGDRREVARLLGTDRWGVKRREQKFGSPWEG